MHRGGHSTAGWKWHIPKMQDQEDALKGGCPHPALLMLELEQGTRCLSLWFANPELRLAPL